VVCFTVYDLLLETLPKDKHSVHEWWYPFQKMGCAAGASSFVAPVFVLVPMVIRLPLGILGIIIGIVVGIIVGIIVIQRVHARGNLERAVPSGLLHDVRSAAGDSAKG
jgi:hypothetical protein